MVSADVSLLLGTGKDILITFCRQRPTAEGKLPKQGAKWILPMKIIVPSLFIDLIKIMSYTTKMSCQVADVLPLTNATLILGLKSLVKAKRHGYGAAVCWNNGKPSGLVNMQGAAQTECQ